MFRKFSFEYGGLYRVSEMFFIMLGVAIMWGVGDITTKILVKEGVSSSMILFANAVISILVALPFLRISEFQSLSPKITALLIINGLLIMVGVGIFYFALKKMHIATALAIGSSKIVWAMLIAVFFLKDTLSLSSVVGVVSVFIGLLLIQFRG